MVVMRRCCCCGVRAGTVLIGVYTLLAVAGPALASAVFLYLSLRPGNEVYDWMWHRVHQENNTALPEAFDALQTYIDPIMIGAMAYFSAFALGGIFLILTACVKSRILLLLWLLTMNIYLVIQALFVVVLAYALAVSSMLREGTALYVAIGLLIVFALWLALHIYMYVAVCGFWQVIARKAKERKAMNTYPPPNYQPPQGYSQHQMQQMSHAYPNKMPY